MEYYSKEEILSLMQRRAQLKPQWQSIFEKWLNLELNQEANIILKHGFVRRLSTIQRCIDCIFKICPPDTSSLKRDELVDCAIHLQALIINLYGCLDNLCHVINKQLNWNFDNNELGFTNSKNNKRFQKSLSQELRNHLRSVQHWLIYLQEYRHALAHRIPLYVPPNYVTDENADEYRQLTDRWFEALGQSDFEAMDEIDIKLSRISKFIPQMVHQENIQLNPISFHIQILNDWDFIVAFSDLAMEEVKKRKGDLPVPRKKKTLLARLQTIATAYRNRIVMFCKRVK